MASEILEISAMFDPKEEGGTVFIFGGPSAIDHFATLLTTVTKEVSYQLSTPPNHFAEEADIILQQLILSPRERLVSMQHANQTLHISGEQIRLKNIAHSIASLVNAALKKDFYTHQHLDHFSYPTNITLDSIPVIVRVLTAEELKNTR